KPPGVVAGFALDRHRILREHRGSVKESSMMLAAVETVTEADPVWEARRHKSDVPAEATTRESVHAASPRLRRLASPVGPRRGAERPREAGDEVREVAESGVECNAGDGLARRGELARGGPQAHRDEVLARRLAGDGAEDAQEMVAAEAGQRRQRV